MQEIIQIHEREKQRNRPNIYYYYYMLWLLRKKNKLRCDHNGSAKLRARVVYNIWFGRVESVCCGVYAICEPL